MQLSTEIIIALIGFLSTCGSYIVGKRKREKEADKSAYEAYNYALESLRKEFEDRVGRMQNDYNELKEKYKTLQNENEELKRKIQKLEER